ncbi:MAG: phospholipase D family protein [Bacteroidota bacterium]
MAEFLTTNGTSYHIENIILGARKKLVLVSPYLQISKTFLERLKDASKKDVTITIIYGKDELKPSEKKSLLELKNLEIHYFQNLHAKCYFNEYEMVITSMNMYEFSEKNNREMGVYITKEKDQTLFQKAVDETFSILQSSEKLKNTNKEINKPKQNSFIRAKSNNNGFCIRCSEPIPYNIDKPYCIDCYSSWSKYSNLFYEENNCHGCNKKEHATMEKPFCYSCYKKFEKQQI